MRKLGFRYVESQEAYENIQHSDLKGMNKISDLSRCFRYRESTDREPTISVHFMVCSTSVQMQTMVT